MKKKVLHLFAVLCASICLFAFAACNGSGDPPKSKLAIDPDYKFADAELGESYSLAVGSVEVTGEGGADLTVSVKDNTLTRPDGKTLKLIGGKFTPDVTGEYKLTLVVEDHEEIDPVEKTIVCKDTKGPEVKLVEGQTLQNAALIGQTVPLPKVGGTDPSGLSDEVVVKVLQPDGKEGTLSEDKTTFTPSVAGSHTYSVTMKDKVGNASEYKGYFTVYNTEYNENTLAYFSSEYGKEQADAWIYHENYLTEAYIEDVTKVNNGKGDAIPAVPSGNNGATCLTAATGNKMLYYIHLPVNDLTKWDYAGMWIYNDSDYPLFPFLVGDGFYNPNVIPARTWFYLTYNLRLTFKLDQMIGVGNPNEVALNDVQYLTIAFRQILPTSTGQGEVNTYTQNDKIYLTDMELKHFTKEGPIAEFDQPWGTAHIAQFNGDRENYYFGGYDKESKEEGTEGSTSLVVRKDVASINPRIFGLNAEKNDVFGKTFKMWFKNGTAHDVTVSDGKGNSSKISANSDGYVRVKIDDTTRTAEGPYGTYGVWSFTISGDLKAGDKFYLGAITNEEQIVANAENALTSYESLGVQEFCAANVSMKRVLKAEDTQNAEHFYGTENMSVRIDTLKNGAQIRVWFDMDKKDWSQYDYVKFYVYNDTNTGFELQTVDNELDSKDQDCKDNDPSDTEPNLIKPIVGKGEWVPVVVPLYKDGMRIASCKGGVVRKVSGVDRHANYSFYELTDVESFGLFFAGTYTADGSIWISTITGGKYAEEVNIDNNLVISLNGDINPFRSATSSSVNALSYTASHEAKYADSDDAVKGTTTIKAEITASWSGNIRISGKFFRQTLETGDKARIWVYNASDATIKITPFGGEAQTIQAGQGSYIEMPVRIGQAGSYDFQLTIARESGNLEVGDAIYFGNVYKVVTGA